MKAKRNSFTFPVPCTAEKMRILTDYGRYEVKKEYDWYEDIWEIQIRKVHYGNWLYVIGLKDGAEINKLWDDLDFLDAWIKYYDSEML